MTSRSVVYGRTAQRHLDELWDYIADANAPAVASDFVASILDFCDGLAYFPSRGSARDDIRPGLRTIGFRRRALIAFTTTESTVVVLGVFYGGRDHEALLAADDGPA